MGDLGANLAESLLEPQICSLAPGKATYSKVDLTASHHIVQERILCLHLQMKETRVTGGEGLAAMELRGHTGCRLTWQILTRIVPEFL